MSIHCLKQQLSVFDEATGARQHTCWIRDEESARKKNAKGLNGGRCLATDAIALCGSPLRQKCTAVVVPHDTKGRGWRKKKIIMQAFPGLVPSDRYYNNITHPCTNTPLSVNASAEKILTALSSRLIHPSTTGALSKQCIFSLIQKEPIWVCSRRIIT